jgi:MFS family permease
LGRPLIEDSLGEATAPVTSKFFYGWVIVAVGILVFALAYGVRYSFAVVFSSLLEEFQWSRGAAATILSLHLLAYGVTAPLAGTLVDKIGARSTMSLGAVLLALGAATSGLATALWHFYLAFGLLMGMGISLVGAVPFTRIIGNWFLDRRGMALSLLFFGSGGAYLLYPLVALLIDRIGWRGTFVVEAAIAAGLLLPAVALLIRNSPWEKGLQPDGRPNSTPTPNLEQALNTGAAVPTASPHTDAADWTLRKAIKSLRFWALCLCAFSVWGITEHILVAHHIAFAEDVGYSNMYASAVLALFGVLMSVGALLGLVSDRIGREATFGIGMVIGVSGIVVLMLIQDTSQPWMLYAYPILFGLGFGMTTPTIAAAATDMFQGHRAGAVIGFIWFSFAIGGTIGPWLGGYIFEVAGSYLPAFLISAATFVVAFIAMWVAAPRRARRRAG